MKKYFSWSNLIFFVLLAFLLWQRVPLYLEQARLEGEKLPDTLQLRTLDGKLETVKLTGKKTAFVFWATWCPPCKIELARLKSSWSEIKGVDRLYLISIDQNSEVVQKYLNDSKIRSYIDPSSSLMSVFKARGTPTTVLVNKDGRIENVWTGANPFFISRIIEHLVP